MSVQVQGDSDEVVSEIDLTPLVGAHARLAGGVHRDRATPQQRGQGEPPPDRTHPQSSKRRPSGSFSVNSEGKVYLDTAEVALTGLEGELKTLRATEPELAVVSQHSNQRPTRARRQSNVIGRSRGVTKLSVLTANE